jgi:hypothetical protein
MKSCNLLYTQLSNTARCGVLVAHFCDSTADWGLGAVPADDSYRGPYCEWQGWEKTEIQNLKYSFY